MGLKTYELSFDVERARYKKETIVADVLKRGPETPCELEQAEFEFPEDILELDVAFDPGATEVRADVGLREEVYGSDEFSAIIEKGYEVTLRAVPREAAAGGGYKLGPAVTKSCIVQCDPIQPAFVLKEPAEEELPLPAVGDEPRDLVLQITMGPGGKPWPALALRWERVKGGCSSEGSLEAGSNVTDSSGEIRLSYTAPKLYYKPGATFFEEFRFVDARKEGKELFRLKIPLAPWIVYRFECEKAAEIESVKYGIVGPMTAVTEIDPHDRVKAFEATMMLKTALHGEERQFPVQGMECKILLGDENGVEEEQEGLLLKTDSQGKLLWEIQELCSAFGERGKTRELSADRGELPVLELTGSAKQALELYEGPFQDASFPQGVFQKGLGERLRRYRFVHCEQLAKEETLAYEKIRDTMEILGIGVRYVAPFHRGVSRQFTPLLGVLGDTFWDFFNYVWNMKDIPGKIFGLVSSGASAIAEAIARRCVGSVAVVRSLLSKLKPLAWAIQKIVGFIEWMASKVSSLAGVVAQYIPGLKQFAERLASENRMLFDLLGEIESKGLEALAKAAIVIQGVVMAVADAVRYVFEVVAGLLERFAFWLLSRVAASLRLFEESFFQYLEGYAGTEAVHRAIEYFMQAIELKWHGAQAVEGVLVQVGNYLQSIVETFFGKGTWGGGGASRAVSSFAAMNLFDPAATIAVWELHESCIELGVSGDPKGKLVATRDIASRMADVQLSYEQGFIMGEAIKMFVDSMKIPVQVALAAILTLTTLGGGAAAIGPMCVQMEMGISTLAICLLDVPHAIAIFLGACLIQEAYLTAVANLEV